MSNAASKPASSRPAAARAAPSSVVGDTGRAVLGRLEWRRVLILAVAAVAVAAAACDGPPSPGASSVSSGAGSRQPQATSSVTTESERTAVEAAYRKFWEVSWDVDKQPAVLWRPLLATVYVDPELTRLYAGTKAQNTAGIQLYGKVVPRPSVLRLAGGRAEVRDCQDASKAGQADARSGTPKTVGVARAPVTASLVRGPDGVWRVSDVRYTGGSC